MRIFERSLLGSALVVVLSSALIAAGFNLFLIPHQLLSGGLSGIAMIIGYLTGFNIPILYLILNLPVLIWGLMVIGRRFIVLSALAVVTTTWFMKALPVTEISNDPIMSSVTGGVLVGIASGIAMRAGGSTGGIDIIGSIITRKRDFPLGTILFGINGLIILSLGFFKQNWDPALYSMLSIFITGKVMDTIHIRHLKVTVFIVTQQKDLLLSKMQNLQRGITVMDTEGAYTKQSHHMLMTVTTRYELNDLQSIIKQYDPHAFVNITETVGVMGLFRR